ncbi:MAG: radical SAM protein [Candidatus Bathyarchaeota archaeon]|nr:radical SAM protein [Candidatus Bathyarchaeota archaeon]
MSSLTAISNFAVTNQCNGKCNMCNIWKMEPTENTDIDKITGFFHENKDSLRGVKFIQLTGGEPFLRDDLPDIASVVHETMPGCMIWLPTNGLLPEKIIEITQQTLIRNDDIRLGVTVSLDGEGEYHDIQRGIDGSFKLAMKTLMELKKVKKYFPNLHLSTGFTLTASNYKQAPLIQKRTYRHGADFSVRPVNISEHYYQNLGDKRVLDLEDLNSIIKQMAYSVQKEKGILGGLTTLAYLQGVHEFLNEGRTLACSAASESIYIDSAGDVYPCIVMNHLLGNIYENSLKEILASEETKKARIIISELKCPTCWLECDAYRDVRKDGGRLLRAYFWSLNRFSL